MTFLDTVRYRLNPHPPDPLEQAARELPTIDDVTEFMGEGGGL